MGIFRRLLRRKRDHPKAIGAVTSEIRKVQFFVEPPAFLPNIGTSNFDITGLPHDFIETADRQIGLGGKLRAYVHDHELKIEKIARLDDSHLESFFAHQSGSPLWQIFYGSGGSGARYTVLVEFATSSEERFPSEKSRRKVYLEYEKLYEQALMEQFLANPAATTEKTIDVAMSSASHTIMVKYGLSQAEMIKIIEEGLS